MKNIKFGSKGLIVNSGANYIHGGCLTTKKKNNCNEHNSVYNKHKNPMLTLANKYNIKYFLPSPKNALMLDGTKKKNNKILSNKEKLKSFLKWQKTNKCLRKLQNKILDKKIEDMLLSNAFILCGWKQSELTPFEKTIDFLSTAASNGLLNNFVTMNNEAIFERNDHWFGDHTMPITDQRGFQSIVLNIAEEYLNINYKFKPFVSDDKKLKLNSKIIKIKYDKKYGIECFVINLETNKRSIYRSKYGLVTLPLGVLKKNIVKFVPNLPSWKLNAWNGISMAAFVVIFIEWPYDFWTKQYPNSDNKNAWAISDDRYGYYVAVENYNNQKYFKNSLIWRLIVAAIDETNKIEIFQNNKEAFVKHFIDSKLKYFFDIDKIPKPLNVFISNWNENEFAHGAFPSFNKYFKYDTDVKKLEKSVEDVLYFAGDGANNAVGYTHSAYLSALKQAYLILESLGYSYGTDYDTYDQINNGYFYYYFSSYSKSFVVTAVGFITFMFLFLLKLYFVCVEYINHKNQEIV